MVNSTFSPDGATKGGSHVPKQQENHNHAGTPSEWRFQAFYGKGDGILFAAPEITLEALQDGNSKQAEAIRKGAKLGDDQHANSIAFNAVLPIETGENGRKAARSKTEDIEALTGFITLDIDAKDNPALRSHAWIKALNSGEEFAPFVAFAEVSKSGGLHIVCYAPHDQHGNQLEATPKDGNLTAARNHHAAQQAIIEKLQGSFDRYGFDKFDLQHVTNRLSTYLKTDSPVYVNPRPEPFTAWIMPPRVERKQAQLPSLPPTGKRLESGKFESWAAIPEREKVSLCLDLLSPEGMDYNEWIRALAGASGAGLTEDEVEQWSARSGKHDSRTFHQKFPTLNKSGIGALIEMAGGMERVKNEAISQGLLTETRRHQGAIYEYHFDDKAEGGKASGEIDRPDFRGSEESPGQSPSLAPDDDEDNALKLEAPDMPDDLWDGLRAALPAFTADCERRTDEPSRRIAIFRSIMSLICPHAPNVTYVDGERNERHLTLHLHIIAGPASGKGAIDRLIGEAESPDLSLTLQAQHAGAWLDNDVNKRGAFVYEALIKEQEASEAQRMKGGGKEKKEVKPIHSHMAARIMRNKGGLFMPKAADITDAALLDNLTRWGGVGYVTASEAAEVSATAKGQHNGKFIEYLKKGVACDRIEGGTKGEGMKRVQRGKLSVLITSTPNQLHALYGGVRMADGFLDRAAFHVLAPVKEEERTGERPPPKVAKATIAPFIEAAALLNLQAGIGTICAVDMSPEGKKHYRAFKAEIEANPVLKKSKLRMMERAYATAGTIAFMRRIEATMGKAGMIAHLQELRDQRLKAIKMGLESGSFSLPDCETSQDLTVTAEDVRLAVEIARMEAEMKEKVIRHITLTTARSEAEEMASIVRGREKEKAAAKAEKLRAIREILADYSNSEEGKAGKALSNEKLRLKLKARGLIVGKNDLTNLRGIVSRGGAA